MTDRDALLAAVCAAPDDDLPRLVFADWLEEHGADDDRFRAEYIRAAVALAREEPWSPGWRAAHRRYEPLHARATEPAGPGRGWTAHLKGRVKAWTLDRGLVGGITVYSERFVAEAAKFFAADPVTAVKFVTLASPSGSVKPADLFACPHLARLSKLNLDGSDLDRDAVDRLATSHHLIDLRGLSVGGQNPVAARAGTLLYHLPQLSEVSLNGNGSFTDARVMDLASNWALRQVSVLDLCGTPVTAAGVRALVASPHAANLTELSLTQETLLDEEHGYPVGYVGTDEDGLDVALAIAGATLPKLAALTLTGRRVGDAGLYALAGAAGLPTLRRLSLADARLTHRGVEWLAASPLGQQLYYLDVSFNPGLVGTEVRSLFPNARVESRRFGAA